MTAQKLASIVIDAESCLYSQWFPGKQNDVSDASSRYFHLSDFKLTKFILTSVPHQAPNSFKICPSPNEITSWLISLLQNQPQEMLWNQEPLPRKLSLGLDSLNTSTQYQSYQTLSSTTFQNFNESKSLKHLLMHYEKVNSIKNKT
jgi:hypothetical protein